MGAIVVLIGLVFFVAAAVLGGRDSRDGFASDEWSPNPNFNQPRPTTWW
jgi:hypothetical protein